MTNNCCAPSSPSEGYVTIEYSVWQRALKAALPLALALSMVILVGVNPSKDDLIKTLLWCAGFLYWASRVWLTKRRTVPEVIYVPQSARRKKIGIAILIAAPFFALWAALVPSRSEAEQVFIGILAFCSVAPFAWLFLKKNEEYTSAARKALGLPDPPPNDAMTWAHISALGQGLLNFLKGAAGIIVGLAVVILVMGVSITALTSAFSSAPWWAIAIIVLLVLVLLK